MKNSRPVCPNTDCEHHEDPPRGFYRKNGYYRPKHNHQPVPRYQCKACGKSFCATQGKAIRRHHRPELNRQIFKLAVSGVSMRRIGVLLGCSKRTVARKIEHLASLAQVAHAEHLATMKTAYVMMDELETFLHARYRQVSVPVVVRVKTGDILAFGVARIPSSMKQGIEGHAWVKNDRPKVVKRALKVVKPLLKKEASIATDGDASYPKWIRSALPKIRHHRMKTPKESNLGRARKKASGERREHDPLFAVNVLFAKMRNDLARLGRKTWTTTKTIQGLEDHLWLYVAWVNGYALR